MAYQYRGDLKGEADPWVAPADPVPPARQPTEPCGTYAACQRHYRHGETPCDPCRAARNAYERSRRPKNPRPGAVCGTYAGYQKHYLRDDQPCRSCKDAYNEYRRQHRAQKRATQNQNTEQKAA